MQRLATTHRVLPIVVALLLVGSSASAGHLEPPPGPVLPTDRTQLDGQRIELPYTISVSGSYVLTSDLRDCLECDDLPGHGIVIDADDVTLDLNGFAIVGDPGNSLSGIVAVAGRRNIAVMGGVVRDWGGVGVDLGAARSSRVASMRVTSNGGNGINLGTGGLLESCTSSDNGGQGMLVAPGSVVTHATATGNASDGIVAVATAVPSGSSISDCSVRGNGGAGIMAGDGTTIRGCSVSTNGGPGIHTGLGCTITDNAIVVSGGAGILTYSSLVRGNTSRFNTGADINAADSTVIENHDGD